MTMAFSLDETSLNLAKFNNLKYNFKKESSESFSHNVNSFLENLENPYEFLCAQIKNDKELYHNRINSFPSQFLLEFNKFITNNKNIKDKLLTQSLQLTGFEIFKHIKHNVLQNAILNIFSLSSAQDLLLPLLMSELQKENKISNICSMILKLNFQSKFTIQEIVIPLFLQDKIGIIEQFLDVSSEMQIEFLHILDGIVGGQIEINDLILSSNIKGVKGPKSPKIIYKLGMRLMKKYNATEVCPYILRRHKLSSLRYLFQKYYYLNELSLHSLLLFCDEICEDNLYLRTQTLDLFVEYADYLSAVDFLKNKHIPEQNIPHQIKTFLKDEKQIEITQKMRSINEQQSQKNKSGNFYSLSISTESIYQINNVSDFDKTLFELNKYTVIGVDTEWKPTLQFDKEEELMLLQVAVNDKVYLFDMLYLRDLLSNDHWDRLGQLFSHSDVTKLTYSFTGDLKCLGEFNFKLQEHMKKIKNLIDLNETKRILLECCPNFFFSLGSNESNHKGLSEMVFLCFGKPLDKTEQCSYWSRRPLTRNQILYAALDAFCLLDIYNYLNEKAKEFNISDWRSLESNFVQMKLPQSQVNLESKCDIAKKNKHKAPVGAFSPKICASSFKVVCDSMLQGLGKRLRSCNIDTIILGSSDYHEKCIECFEKESRVILTRGNVYHRMRKYIPSSHILSVKSDKVEEQLKEVTSRFGVVVADHDLLARCCECNSDKFLSVQPDIISKTKSCRGKKVGPPCWVNVDHGRARIHIQEGVTHKGVKLRLNEVPYGVLNRVDRVYVCDVCGKCYWDGTHLARLRSNLGSIVSPKRMQTHVSH